MKSLFALSNIYRLAVSFLLAASYLLFPSFVFPGGGLIGHLLYPLSHANIFHLLANLLCLWMIYCRLHLLPAFAVAVVCSFLPCFVAEPTMGFSGVLFAILGISWGRVHRFKDMLWRNKWFLVIPMFIPHVNGFIHLYCLVGGYFVGSMGWMSKDERFSDFL